MCKNWLLVLLSILVGVEQGVATPPQEKNRRPTSVQSHYDTVKAPVLKVFEAAEGKHRFIAYLVKWKESEVVVSDPLATSHYQVGDTIEFMVQRVSLPKPEIEVDVLHFIVLDSPRPKQARAVKNKEERFYALGDAARTAFNAGKLDEARALAEELATLAATLKNDWNYGNAIQVSNQVLGQIALTQGDVDEAKKRLLASAESDGSPQMNSFGPNMQLAKELIEQGETETVLEYFQRCRRFWKMGSDRLDSWTEVVKEGQTPDFGANLDY